MSVAEQIKQLYEEGFYGDIVQLMGVLLPNALNYKDPLTPQQDYQTHLYYADALFETGDYVKAETFYRKALDLRKVIVKNKKKGQSSTSQEVNADVDLRYRIYLCAKQQQDYTKALLVLENIPMRQRTTKINVALAELYQQNKSDNNAVACYKEVLREHPFALKVITNLLKLGVKSNEIISIVMTSTWSLPKMEWLPTWIRAKAFLYSPEVSQAVTLYKQLQSKPIFSDSPDILLSLAESLYCNGDYKKAILAFKKAYALDPLMIRGMDMYAACLVKENEIKELEKLANNFIPRCELGEAAAEPWIVLAYFCFVTNKKEAKALYFAQKACLLSANSSDALVLKGLLLVDNQKYVEAISCFSEAFNKSPYKFEVVKCLADAYLADNRKPQAINMANHAFKHLGQSPRTLTLFATVLLADTEKPSNKKNAKTSLEKAIKLDSSYLPAVYLLVNLYIEEKNIDKAIEILNKALESESNNKLHRMLGDCYTEKNEHDKALHHHNIASKLEVSYRNSAEASQRLEQQSSRTPNPECTLDMEGEEAQESENEVDETNSDTVWSDADF